MPKALPQTPRRNAPWTPLQRRTWLAVQRREGHLLPAPVLRPKYPSKLVWNWDRLNPYKWNVWQSLDGGATFFLVDGYWMYGDARQFAPDGGGELHFIVGVDANGKEITQHSNAVRPDDGQPTIPDAAQNFTATDVSVAIQLAWPTVTDGTVTGYRIYRKVDAGSFALYRSVGVYDSPQQDASVISAHTYYYYLTAYNVVGESAPSPVVSVTFNAS